MKEKAALIGLLLLMFYIFVGVFFWSMNRSEVNECLELKKQSEEFPNFWLSQWQADMCASHDININAPVK